MVYSVMVDAIDKGVELEVVFYDLAKCFDSMWWEGTSNDLWDKNVTDDKFALICTLINNAMCLSRHLWTRQTELYWIKSKCKER